MSTTVVSRNNVLAGAFVIGGLILAVAISFILGDVLGKLGSKHEYTVRFPTSVGVTGLQPGAEVQFAGLPVGQVIGVEPDRDPETGTADTMSVRISIDARIALYENAYADLSPPLLGGVSKINIASAGTGRVVDPPAPDPVDAASDSEMNGRISSLFLSDPLVAVSNNDDGKLDPGEEIRGQFAPSILAQLGFSSQDATNIRMIINDFRTVSENAKEVSERFSRMAASLEPSFETSVDDGRSAIASIRSASERIDQGVESWSPRVDSILTNADRSVAEVPEIFDDARLLVSDLRRTITSNGQTVSRILANAEVITERVRFETMEQAEELLQQGTMALTSYQDVADNVDGLITSARPDIGIVLTNARSISQKASLLADEIRSQPWRLLKQPSNADLEKEPIYSAARAYADAVADLRATSEALDAAVQATTEGSGSDGAMDVVRISQAVELAYARYAEAERALLDRLLEE